MGLIVLVVGARAGHFHGLLPTSEVAVKMVVEELSAVVSIDPEQGKRKGCFDLDESVANPVLASVPGRADFCPAAEDISEGEAPDEVPAHVSTAVRHGIRFAPPGFLGVPTLGPYRHQCLDRSVGFRCPPIDDPGTDLSWSKNSINLSGTNGEHSVTHFRSKGAEVFFIEWQPLREHRPEAFAARLFGALPDLEDDEHGLGRVEFRSPAPRRGGMPSGGRTPASSEELGGILPLVSCDQTELVEEAAFSWLSGVAPVSAAHRFQVFVAGGSAHGSCHAPRCPRL